MNDVTLTRASTSADPRGHLLLVHGGNSSRIDLPTSGALVIGRGEDADIRIDDAAVSRRHARITSSGGEVSVVDLGSHNGTRVNGELVAQPRTLASSDVVGIGDALIVVTFASPPARRGLLDPTSFRRRLDEELERAVTYDRSVGVIWLALGAPGWKRDAVADALDEALRAIDLAGQVGDRQVAVIAPELDRAALVETAARAIAALAPVAGAVRVGVALCPIDGCHGAALLAAARTATEVAEVGTIVHAADRTVRLRLGDRTTLVADPAMVRLYELIRRLAASDLSVVVYGETGAGKEHAAAALHHLGPRAAGPFVTLNSAAVQDTLVESELFGHEKGSFTGAAATKQGLLELAHGGTLFLDEVGELSPAMQAKFLRALETRRITRVGGMKELEIDVRVVAATNRDLEREVAEGRFRQDLFFRLCAATVTLPPLRERPQEIAALADEFLREARGEAPAELATATIRALQRYAWPGNIRELKNAMNLVAATTDDTTIEPWHLPERILGATQGDGAAATAARGAKPFRPVAEEVRELEKRRMREALEAAGGVQRRAAELIGMPLRTFVMKLKQYGLTVTRRVD